MDSCDTSGISRVTTTNGDNVDGLPVNDASQAEVDLVTIPCYNDMLLMFATSEGNLLYNIDEVS